MRSTVAAAALVALAAAGAAASTGGSAPGTGPSPAPARDSTAAEAPQVAVLETTLGVIVIRLAEAEAPRTAANFRRLVAAGYYDGTRFHRVVPGFVIQGGDPNSRNDNPNDDGRGGPGYTLPAEIGLPHVRGAVAAVRRADAVNPARESSGSQFFISVAAQPSLDRDGHTVFGQVLAGMDVVDRIAALGHDTGLPGAGGGGRNPGPLAQIVRASLQPLASWERTAPAATPREARPRRGRLRRARAG